MKLVYINNSTSTVFDSQVLTLLQYYVNNDFFEEVILIFGYQTKKEISWLNEKDTKGIKIYYFKSFPNYPFFNYVFKKSMFTTLCEVTSNFSDYFFHIRGEMTSYHFKKLMPRLAIKPYQLLTDVRGVSIQELVEYSTSNKIAKKLKLSNYNKAFNDLLKDVNISVVSAAFKNYLISSLNINKNSIFVNSCLVNQSFKFSESERVKTRNKLAIKNDEILIIFTSGGTANWQNNDMIIQLANKGFKVLNLSKKTIDHKNVITRFVAYNKVPNYLSAADVAFIWRDKSLVNKVASPVKVSEYLACGLPVVHNGTVDLIKDLEKDNIKALEINSVIKLTQDQLNKLIKTNDRQEQSGKVIELFGVQKIANSYANIYLS